MTKNKKKWCEGELDKSGDSEKSLTGEVATLASGIAEMKDSIEGFKTEVAAAQDRIAAMDKSVAEATEQRQKENAEFSAATAANNMAIKLIGKAKNKLLKFYNPDLAVEEKEEYVASADDLEQERIASAASGVFVQIKQAPAPSTWDDSYGGKTQKSGGVMALMDKLTKEIETNQQEAAFEEKDAQKEYEELVADAQKTRADDVKTLGDKNTNKADTETSLEEAKATHSLKTEALANNGQYIADLHTKCDFVLKTFEERREARNAEIKGLGNAKAVLSGADYN